MSQGNSGNDGGGPPSDGGPPGQRDEHPVFGEGGPFGRTVAEPTCPKEDCDGMLMLSGPLADVRPEDIIKFILAESETVKILQVECDSCDWSKRQTVALRDSSVRNT